MVRPSGATDRGRCITVVMKTCKMEVSGQWTLKDRKTKTGVERCFTKRQEHKTKEPGEGRKRGVQGGEGILDAPTPNREKTQRE